MNISPAHGVQTGTDPPKTSSNSSWLMTLLDGLWFFFVAFVKVGNRHRNSLERACRTRRQCRRQACVMK